MLHSMAMSKPIQPPATSRRSEPQGDLRGSVDYKKHLAGVLVARGLRHALGRLGVQA